MSVVLSELNNGVLRLTMNRPTKKNALTQELYGLLADGILEAQDNADIRVIMITGAGDAFTAGNDLSDFAAGDRDKGEELPVGRFLRSLVENDKPLIAAVNGVAVGVGVTMLLHTDLVYAGESASFQVPFTNLGLVPEAASSLLLPLTVGIQRANELFLLGNRIDAAEAEKIGLVLRTVADGELLDVANKAAAQLAAKAPTALKLTKQLVRQSKETLKQRMADESVHFGAQLKSPEFAEAATAFAERRPADFSKIG